MNILNARNIYTCPQTNVALHSTKLKPKMLWIHSQIELISIIHGMPKFEFVVCAFSNSCETVCLFPAGGVMFVFNGMTQ